MWEYILQNSKPYKLMHLNHRNLESCSQLFVLWTYPCASNTEQKMCGQTQDWKTTLVPSPFSLIACHCCKACATLLFGAAELGDCLRLLNCLATLAGTGKDEAQNTADALNMHRVASHLPHGSHLGFQVICQACFLAIRAEHVVALNLQVLFRKHQAPESKAPEPAPPQQGWHIP